MLYGEVLVHLLDGKKVRHINWDSGYYVYMDDEVLRYENGDEVRGLINFDRFEIWEEDENLGNNEEDRSKRLTYIGVMRVLLDGGSIRRSSWEGGRYIRIVEGRLLDELGREVGGVATLSNDDDDDEEGEYYEIYDGVVGNWYDDVNIFPCWCRVWDDIEESDEISIAFISQYRSDFDDYKFIGIRNWKNARPVEVVDGVIRIDISG